MWLCTNWTELSEITILNSTIHSQELGKIKLNIFIPPPWPKILFLPRERKKMPANNLIIFYFKATYMVYISGRDNLSVWKIKTELEYNSLNLSFLTDQCFSSLQLKYSIITLQRWKTTYLILVCLAWPLAIDTTHPYHLFSPHPISLSKPAQLDINCFRIPLLRVEKIILHQNYHLSLQEYY